MGASASWNYQGLSRPVMGLLYLYLYFKDPSFSSIPYNVRILHYDKSILLNNPRYITLVYFK